MKHIDFSASFRFFYYFLFLGWLISSSCIYWSFLSMLHLLAYTIFYCEFIYHKRCLFCGNPLCTVFEDVLGYVCFWRSWISLWIFLFIILEPAWLHTYMSVRGLKTQSVFLLKCTLSVFPCAICPSSVCLVARSSILYGYWIYI